MNMDTWTAPFLLVSTLCCVLALLFLIVLFLRKEFDERSRTRRSTPLGPSAECSGHWLGYHRFEGRFTEHARDLKYQSDRGSPARSADDLRKLAVTKEYLGDVCTRCGMRVYIRLASERDKAGEERATLTALLKGTGKDMSS